MTTDNSPLVEIRELTKVYTRGKQRVEVLHGINLIFRPVICRADGAVGFGQNHAVELIGRRIRRLGPVESAKPAHRRFDQRRTGRLRANTVGFIFQSYNLMPVLTAQRNVELPYY